MKTVIRAGLIEVMSKGLKKRVKNLKRETYTLYLVYKDSRVSWWKRIFALIATSIFQKFPSPWAKEDFHAPMTKPGLFGFPHGAGYLVTSKTIEET